MARPKKNADAPAQEVEQAEPTSEKAAKASAPAFVFVGDAKGHGPDTLSMFGLTFEKNGDPVEVDNAAFAKRLAGNSHFKAA